MATSAGTVPGGATSKAAAEAETLNRPFLLSPDELIGYIKESAAEQASAAARERLNFFFTLIGIVVGLIAGAAAGVFLMLRANLETAAATAARGEVAVLRAEFEKSVTDRMAALRSENEAAVDKTVNSILLIALMGAEANSLSNDPRGSRPQDRRRMVDLLAERKAEITGLKGQVRDLTFRRIEDIFSSFAYTGDVYAAFRLMDIFGEDLLKIDGAQMTYAWLITTQALGDPGFLDTQVAKIDALLARPYDATNLGLDHDRTVMAVVVDGLRNRRTEDELVARIVAEDADAPGFGQGFDDALAEWQRRFRSNGLVFSAEGQDAVKPFLAASQKALAEIDRRRRGN